MARDGAVAEARMSFGLRVGECLDEDLEDMACCGWVYVVDMYDDGLVICMMRYKDRIPNSRRSRCVEEAM